MSESMQCKIERWIKTYIDNLFQETRIENESNAITVLDMCANNLDVDNYILFCQYCNIEYVKKLFKKFPSCTRFSSQGYGSMLQIKNDTDSFAKFQKLIALLWCEETIDDNIARDYYDRICHDRIRHAGILIYSLLLYLKRPTHYNICTDSLAQGLNYLIGKDIITKKISSYDEYNKYNKLVSAIRKDYQLIPQDVDFILYCGNRARQGPF